MAQPGQYLVDTFPMLNKLPGFLAPWKAVVERHYWAQTELFMGNLKRGLENPGWDFSKHLKTSGEGKSVPVEELAWDLGII